MLKYMNLDSINLDYDLIGIGENFHGDFVSWDIRYKIVKRLIKENKKVFIFSETLDGYIKWLNKKINKFYFDYNRFYPNLLKGSDYTKQHLNITKKFNKLIPNVYFIGIDIQSVNYEDMYNLVNPILKKIMNKYKKKYLENTHGHYRNYYNALIIKDLINYYTKNNENKNLAFVYFAHNDHISFRSKNKKDLPDGYYLKYKLNLNYLSVSTLALNQYWIGNCQTYECKIKEYKLKSKKWEKLFNENKKKLLIIPRNYKYIMPIGYYYNSKNFDYTICIN